MSIPNASDSSQQSLKDWLADGTRYVNQKDCLCAKVISPGFWGKRRSKPPSMAMEHIYKECREEFLDRTMRFTECSYEPIEYVSNYAIGCECVVCGQRMVKKVTRII